MKIEVGRFYRTRGRDRGCVLCIDAPGSYPVVGYIVQDNGEVFPATWDSEGAYVTGSEADSDIVSEWREPVKVEGWVNVYPSSMSRIYDTQHQADITASRDRIACVFVSGQEEVK